MLTVALFETLQYGKYVNTTPCSFIGANANQKLPPFSWPSLTTQLHTTDHNYATVCVTYVAQKLMPRILFAASTKGRNVRLQVKQI